jgi:hypothetical protein
MEKGTIVCAKAPAKGTIPEATEFDQAEIVFGPASK